MRLRCNGCGKVVSTEVPKGTIVRGWIECPECIMKDRDAELQKRTDKALLMQRLNIPKENKEDE